MRALSFTGKSALSRQGGANRGERGTAPYRTGTEPAVDRLAILRQIICERDGNFVGFKRKNQDFYLIGQSKKKTHNQTCPDFRKQEQGLPTSWTGLYKGNSFADMGRTDLRKLRYRKAWIIAVSGKT